MSRTVWFNCHAGVAGDMVLAALVDAGADRDAIGHAVAGLGVDGYAITFERVQRCGVGATWANVVTHAHSHDDSHDGGGDDDDHGPHRPAREILDVLDRSDLPDRVRDRAVAVFSRLAEVEGAIHGIDPADVELHEVGALDSIIDVVGVCAALESLDVDRVVASSIGLGNGIVQTAHGALPHPAPATIRLLADAEAPTHGLDTRLETATPTGAALMCALGTFGPLPSGRPHAVGYGAGTADPPGRANVVQAVVLDAARPDTVADDGAEVTLLETNVDDVTGEVLAHTIDALLDAGAHDAWATPIVMKKGRPAHTLSALVDPSLATTVRAVLVAESGSLGVRATSLRRWPQVREMRTVHVDGHPIGLKVTDHRVKVEFDDAARVAAALGLPVRTVIERAVAAGTQTLDGGESTTS